MTEELLKAMLMRDRGFLYSLYEGPNILKNKRILLNANDSQLNTLLRYLHFVATGKIPIKKQNFEKIPHSKLKLIKRMIEKSSALDLFLRYLLRLHMAYISCYLGSNKLI